MSEIEFQGLDKIIESIESLENSERLHGALGKACALVERSAKEKAPKGNGDLRRSIKSEIQEDEGDLKGIIFTPLEYAPYVEYGTGLFAEEQGRQDVPWHYQDEKGEWHTTSGMKPQPYMRPALDENREQILTILKESLTDG